MDQSAFVALPPELEESEKQSEDFSELTKKFERINRSVAAVGAATYHWKINDDTIAWNGDTNLVFNGIELEEIATGRGYAGLLDPDNFTSRFETVMRNKFRDNGNGVPFSIEYSVKPLGRDHNLSIWVEDIGRWYAGPDGRPNEVYGIVRQIDDRHQRDQHLQFMGNCDPLTGMMNRGRLTEALGETIELASNQEFSSAFFVLAINNLAVVNDSYGFDVADEVVSTIGKRLREVVRTGDVIGRYSGSKFGLILARATPQELSTAADRFLAIARQRVIETQKGPVWAMLSIGGIGLPHKNCDAIAAMSLAEEALSEAMRLPTDGFVSYQPSPGIESERNLNSRCAIEIVQSLKDNNFRLAYQPIVDAATNEVAFHEALLRMRCDNGDVVAAGHLIPIAEKLGLIRLIDRSVVHKVMGTLHQFPQAQIALNISGVTINDPRWFDKITEILEENTSVTDRLTIEITETVALQDLEQAKAFIEKLHKLGCKVAIDDFGAGFTSFRNLKDLDIDKVKIDGSFCENLSHNVDNQYFVRTLVELAKKFDVQVVAEWVETQEDANLLASWGVDFLQGRLFGMADSDAPWGEPIDEMEEVCVVPSEIDFQNFDIKPSPDCSETSKTEQENACNARTEKLQPREIMPNENQTEGLDDNHFVFETSQDPGLEAFDPTPLFNQEKQVEPLQTAVQSEQDTPAIEPSSDPQQTLEKQNIFQPNLTAPEAKAKAEVKQETAEKPPISDDGFKAELIVKNAPTIQTDEQQTAFDGNAIIDDTTESDVPQISPLDDEMTKLRDAIRQIEQVAG